MLCPGGFVDEFDFCATVFSVRCICEVLIHVSGVFGCSVLRGVFVCVKRWSWSLFVCRGGRGISCLGCCRHVSVPLL
jgi:hypothetical protein